MVANAEGILKVLDMSVVADFGLKESVQFFLCGLCYRVCRGVIFRSDSGVSVVFLLLFTRSFDFGLRLFVHLSLTFGECILIFCDGISP